MLALRFGALVLLGLVVFAVGVALSRVTVPAAPRLGHRGIERRRALAEGGLFATVEPLVRALAGLVALLPLERLRAQQERELRRADHPLGLASDEYSALSILSAAVLGAITAGLSLLLGKSAVFSIPASAFGLVLPALQIQEIARRRAKEISRGLPHAIEIAAMCMGAGLDFPASLRLVAEPGRGSRGALAREFSAILEEIGLGLTRREALASFAERVPVAAVRDFVNAVIQAEQRGNPLARVLQVQGRMLNGRRSVAAEEAAARAGVLMILPMVLLVCCILLLLMGPFLVKGIGF